MSIANYTDLQSAVADFLNRDDLTSVIPTFIAMAEADMSRRLRHWSTENRATAEVDTRYSALPADFVEPIRLSLDDDHTHVELTSVIEMQRMRRATRDAIGKPQYYSITQGELEVYPTPDVAYDLEMYYYAKIPALSSASVNNVLTRFPDLYLYGSLLHAAPYLGEDQRITVWASLYEKALNDANMSSDKAKYGTSAPSMKIRSY